MHYIEHKKEIKSYKKEQERLKEIIIRKNFEIDELKKELKKFKKNNKNLTQQNESYKKEVDMLYETINELNKIDS